MAEDTKDQGITEEQEQEAQVFDDMTVFSNTQASESLEETLTDGGEMEDAEDQSDLANLQPAAVVTEDFLPQNVGKAPPVEGSEPPPEDVTPDAEIPPIDNPAGEDQIPEPPSPFPAPEFDPIEFPRPDFDPETPQPAEVDELPELEGEGQAEAEAEPVTPETAAATETVTNPPDEPTEAPTEPPTEAPTEPPTEAPTEPPTEAPTEPPTEAPTEPPTEAPTEPPTEAPTEPPTEAPTEPPTEAPSSDKTKAPSSDKTKAPSSDKTKA
ncbi:MAG: hypothetical protein HQL72_14055, partial [Magnetococcales bacterium]|nr:hypothetical protein [Magnetococcales bacterium]